jgi:hypothetical protein
LPLGDTKRRLI